MGANLVLRDLRDGTDRKLTRSRVDRNALGAFSPDGRWIAYSANRLGRGWQVHRLEVASRKDEALTDDRGACRPDWSPAGDRIAYVTQRWDGKGDIGVLSPEGGPAKRVTPGDSYDYFPAWTPDGAWILFASTTAKNKGPNREGPWHLGLAAASGDGARWLSRSPYSESYPDAAPAVVEEAGS